MGIAIRPLARLGYCMRHYPAHLCGSGKMAFQAEKVNIFGLLLNAVNAYDYLIVHKQTNIVSFFLDFEVS